MLNSKYGLDLLEYPGLETCVKLFKYDLDLPEYPGKKPVLNSKYGLDLSEYPGLENLCSAQDFIRSKINFRICRNRI